MKVFFSYFSIVLNSVMPAAFSAEEFIAPQSTDYTFNSFRSESQKPKYKLPVVYNIAEKPKDFLQVDFEHIKLGTGDCNEGKINIDLNVSAFGFIGDEIGGQSACESAKDDVGDRYSSENCRLKIACSRTKMNKDGENLMSFFTLPRMVSEDFINLKLEKDIVKMERIDALSKFAEKKFGKKLAASCEPRFDQTAEKLSNITCDSTVMDGGFIRMQEKCSLIGNYCFMSEEKEPLKDFHTFLGNKVPVAGEESLLQSFISKRIDSTTNNALGNDNEMLENLTAILNSTDKTDDKIQNVFNKLTEYKKQGKLDPLFGFSSETIDSLPKNFKDSPHYKFFEGLAQSSSSSETIRSSIEKYRMETTKKILTENCPLLPRYSDICSDATALYNSKRIPIWDKNHASMRIPKDEEDERYIMLKAIYPNGIQSVDDFSAIMEAQRCKAFSFVAPVEGRYRTNGVYANQLLDSSSMYENAPSLTGINYGLVLSESQSDYLNSFNVQRYKRPSIILDENDPSFVGPKMKTLRDPAYSGGGALSDEEIKARSNSAEKVENKFDSLSDKISGGLQNSAKAIESSGLTNSNRYFNGGSFNNLSNSVIEKNGQAISGDDSSIVERDSKFAKTPATDSLNDKISELSKKLNSSEENLERMKTEREEAQLQKDKLIKIEEENKTIAELKTQINGLKADAKKESDISAVAKKQNAPEVEAANIASGFKATQFESRNNEGEKASSALAHHSANTSNRASAANSGGDNANQNSSVARSVASVASNASSSDSKISLVFTKMDTLSTEKASEQIYAKIMELKGVPFLIEEGGVVKEIIPKMVNDVVVTDKFGMPIYEKIIVSEKGKRSKVAKAGKAPASIASKADLQRDQEERLKYERVQYLKLKKITNDVLNKK